MPLQLKLVPRPHPARGAEAPSSTRSFIDQVELRQMDDFPIAIFHVDATYVHKGTDEENEIFNALIDGATVVVSLTVGTQDMGAAPGSSSGGVP